MPWRKISTCAGQFIGFSAIQSASPRDDRPFIIDVGHFVGDDEHVLAVLAPVAGLLPLARVHHLRGLDLAIAGIVDGAAHVGFQLAPDAVALGVPEHAAMRFGLEVEQVHLRAQLAVIALGGLFQPGQVRVEAASC
jgi:hypothetical protein